TLALQILGNPWTTVCTVTGFIAVLYFFQKVFPSLDSGGVLIPILPIIITATAHLHYFAHLLNRKITPIICYKSISFRSPLEKMLMAFLRISLSIVASFKAFLNNLFSCSRFLLVSLEMRSPPRFNPSIRELNLESLRHLPSIDSFIPSSFAADAAVPF